MTFIRSLLLLGATPPRSARTAVTAYGRLYGLLAVAGAVSDQAWPNLLFVLAAMWAKRAPQVLTRSELDPSFASSVAIELSCASIVLRGHSYF